ncbi:hypothetical protein HOR19_gp22 [Phage MedPE-SWcel-C56]|uniref:Deoxynucleotide monophosphate kinase n=1 Tax=Phage MedPE-SWcel-C56 TaxID=1871314 RepID=A0A1B1IY20_9CAUD|nr:hypothetical protein HOR19_gp22 [Phage MedPE-SWcel-C56]ANS06215.1 hypothetical protein [Phage MedPE-SWcel-C56]
MKLLIIGHGRHGKDTVAEIMRDYHGWSFRSSSSWGAEHVIYPSVKATHSPAFLAGRDWKWFYENRHDDTISCCGRKFWFDAFKRYNEDNGGDAIAHGVLSEADIYVGMRSRHEFEAGRRLFDHVIWVDASGRLPPEDSSSMELTKEDADIVVDNNSTMRNLWYEVDALDMQLRRLMRLYGKEETCQEK